MRGTNLARELKVNQRTVLVEYCQAEGRGADPGRPQSDLLKFSIFAETRRTAVGANDR